MWKYSICCKSSHQPILCTLKVALLPCSPTKFSLWHASAALGNPKQLILFLITFQNLVIFAPWAPPGLLAFSSVATSHLTFAQNWFPNLVIIWPPGHPVLSWHFDLWLSGILPIRTSGWLVPFFTLAPLCNLVPLSAPWALSLCGKPTLRALNRLESIFVAPWLPATSSFHYPSMPWMLHCFKWPLTISLAS